MTRGNNKIRKKGKIVNAGEFASIMGYSRNSVLQWIKEGMPIMEDGDNGKAYQINTSDAINWLINRSKARNQDKDRDADYDYDRARKMAVDADKAEMERDILRGQLVEVDLVAGLVADRLTGLRSRLLSLPAKYCVKLASQDTREACKETLEFGINDALKEISSRD